MMLRSVITGSKLISALYLLFGLFMFIAVPAFDELYSSMYSNWRENNYLLVKAFHVPGYIWSMPFVFVSVILWVTQGHISSKYERPLNAISGIILFAGVIHAFDWINIFAHCHEWGCGNGLLPTWSLFKWIGD